MDLPTFDIFLVMRDGKFLARKSNKNDKRFEGWTESGTQARWYNKKKTAQSVATRKGGYVMTYSSQPRD